ncbi:metal ABC transporter ATP-binding protein [Candidatus Anaplasma sp. TIGMIC]|uniref:metal ABC transporter ATP-binding protein n=1 Tax=Candidatus Anaplasma sp. TIGMIC TaxID=3020713 RepID=UPI0023303FB0|nr:metal ABC transporter ATP-binding protein [Candidatus Anaplasma sp. TIGMIC]MDB1135105.1 metal ABC transporter ATP-binding protein [Candidatus Anaplasma sp. TIGMIC]
MYYGQHIKEPVSNVAIRAQKAALPMLVADSITLFYGNRKVIDNVSLSVRPREIVTILGPNGGGKTSLVRILVGINRDYIGNITYTGDPVIAYMPQGFRVNSFMPMTVEYLLTCSGWCRKAYPDLQDVMQYVDISRLLSRQVSELSSGEMQLVLLARCMVMKPSIIILDEPVSCMDVEAKNNFYRLIGELVSHFGISVIMTSHDLHCVMACSDRVICINRSIRCEGTPAEITESAKFMSVFPENV